MKKNKSIITKKATKHQFLYWYIISSAIFLFAYTIVAAIFNLSFVFLLAPLSLPVGYLSYLFLKKNAKLLWIYIADMERGLLMLWMDENTIWTDKQKKNVASWIYPRKDIRGEEWDKATRKLYKNEELTKREKEVIKKAKGNPIRLTHDPQDSTQRLHLIAMLIYANVNIKPLDKDVKDRFELTDENMAKFDYTAEINKLRR